MTYKQIETSREVRLWVTRVIIPGAIYAVYYFSEHPDVWENVKKKASGLKDKVKGWFNRG